MTTTITQRISGTWPPPYVYICVHFQVSDSRISQEIYRLRKNRLMTRVVMAGMGARPEEFPSYLTDTATYDKLGWKTLVAYASKESILGYIRENAPTYFAYICTHFHEVKKGTISRQMGRLRSEGLIRRVTPSGEESPLWIITARGAKKLDYYERQRKEKSASQGAHPE